MSTEANFPLRWLCLKPLYGRFSLDHLWPLLRDHRGMVREAVECYFENPAEAPKLIRLHFVHDEVIAA